MRRQLGKREGGRQFGIGSRFAEGLGVRPEKRRSGAPGNSTEILKEFRSQCPQIIPPNVREGLTAAPGKRDFDPAPPLLQPNSQRPREQFANSKLPAALSFSASTALHKFQ